MFELDLKLLKHLLYGGQNQLIASEPQSRFDRLLSSKVTSLGITPDTSVFVAPTPTQLFLTNVLAHVPRGQRAKT